MRYVKCVFWLTVLLGLSAQLAIPVAVLAQNSVGEVQFTASTKVVKDAGVWIDGLYVGHLGKLPGSGRLRLSAGEHQIAVRLAGYTDFDQKVAIEPRKVADVRVTMEADSRFVYPDPKTGSAIRLDVQPGNAAVMLDGTYVGTVDDFYGVDHSMIVIPGKHDLKIALAGFRTFETIVDLAPRQRFEIRTEMVTASANEGGPTVRSVPPSAASAANVPNSTPAQ